METVEVGKKKLSGGVIAALIVFLIIIAGTMVYLVISGVGAELSESILSSLKSLATGTSIQR